MDSFKKIYVDKLLLQNDTNKIVNEIEKIEDAELLHIIARNYNWDNGFDIPYSIINNKYCDLGTALMIFYDADGFRALDNREELENTNLNDWATFILEIEKKISEKKYTVNKIKFIPPLTKVQIYKLKKKSPAINSIFLDETDGDIID